MMTSSVVVVALEVASEAALAAASEVEETVCSAK